jgi:hypothetical protein
MPPPVSIDDLVSELRATQLARAEAGISATLVCDPDVAVGRIAVRVLAKCFASPDVLAELIPVVTCAELADFGARRMDRRPGFVGEYVLKLPRGVLDPGTTYHMTLRAEPDASALALYTLHTFTKRVVAAARPKLRELLFSAGSRKRPRRSRASSTAGSPRRGRARRRTPPAGGLRPARA